MQLNKFAPCTKSSVNKKRWWVAEVGNSLLGGAGAPICWPDVLSTEVCCLLGAGTGGVSKTLPNLVQSTKHYLLLLFCMGTSDTGRSRLRRTRKDYRALRVTVRNFAELVFFSWVVLVTRKGFERASQIWLIDKWTGVQLPHYRHLRSMGWQGGHTANSLPWTSEEQTVLIRDLLGIVPWDRPLKGRRTQENWPVFEDHLPQAQEQCIPTKWSQAKSLRRPAWMNKELLDKLRHKKKVYEKEEARTSRLWGM